MKHRSRRSPNSGPSDFLSNQWLGALVLFIIALFLINPITKKRDVEEKAEFQIVMEWDKNVDDDVDIYVQDPIGNKIWFSSKNKGIMHLDRDDLGYSNDTIILPNGHTFKLNLNREVVSIRGRIPGEYIINVHMYMKRSIAPLKVRVQLIQVNTYIVLDDHMVTLTYQGEEQTIVRFTLDHEGQFKSKNRMEAVLVMSGTEATMDNINIPSVPSSPVDNDTNMEFGK